MSADQHEPDTDSRCPDCGETFASFRGMRIHQGHGCGDGADGSPSEDDDAKCPTCGETFASDRGVKVHHARAHGESLAEPETSICQQCGDEFEVVAGGHGKYCSRECFHASQREGETVECPVCGESFWATPSELDKGRTYCSNECYGEALDTTELRKCKMCGRTFRIQRRSDKQYCCRACMAEHRSNAPRPNDISALLWLLYVYEDHSTRETYRRQRAVLSASGALTKDEVRERLVGIGVYDPGGAGRRALEEADPDDFGRSAPDGDDSWRQYQRWGEQADDIARTDGGDEA